MEMLKLKDVKLTYETDTEETVALDGINLAIDEGEFVAIVGPSGCGKTTLLSLISGLISPSSGEILLNGERVVGPNSHIGYMLQRDTLLPWRTIKRNVVLGLEIQHKLTAESSAYADKLLVKYGLGDFADYFPSQLSGGMRQRAALIRTLAYKPSLLLLDEPFSALDFQTRLQVGEDVSKIIRSEQKTALLVTHDISEAISLADKIIVLSVRPAKVRYEHIIDIDEKSPIARRESPRFGYWFDTIWKEVSI